jgi:hypothetical protein
MVVSCIMSPFEVLSLLQLRRKETSECLRAGIGQMHVFPVAYIRRSRAFVLIQKIRAGRKLAPFPSCPYTRTTTSFATLDEADQSEQQQQGQEQGVEVEARAELG